MLPPLVRRCPNCGYLGRTDRFERVADEDGTGTRPAVECPRCGHQFETRERPWLAAIGLTS